MKTVNYELSMKLREAGVKQIDKDGHLSHFAWVRYPDSEAPIEMDRYLVFLDNSHPVIICSAFSSSELLEMLPDMFYVIRLPKDYGVEGYNGKWAGLSRGGHIEVVNDNLSDALAELLLWVKEREAKK